MHDLPEHIAHRACMSCWSTKFHGAKKKSWSSLKLAGECMRISRANSYIGQRMKLSRARSSTGQCMKRVLVQRWVFHHGVIDPKNVWMSKRIWCLVQRDKYYWWRLLSVICYLLSVGKKTWQLFELNYIKVYEWRRILWTSDQETYDHLTE